MWRSLQCSGLTMRDSLTRPSDAAFDYFDRGWQPIPVPYRRKNPGRDGWQDERRTRIDLEDDFAGRMNIGVLLGESSKGLVDIDQDVHEASLLARDFLPRTGSVFGRKSEPHRHWLYYADPIPKTRRYKDVTPDGKDGETLIEIRSTGGQTVFPPSAHEQTGEIIRWDRDGDPLAVNGDELFGLVRRLAAATIVARHWPSEGGRHDASLALAGGLVRGGWEREQVEAFIEAVARAAGDNEWEDRSKNVETTIRRLKDDEEAVGFPTLANILGEKVVDRVRDWLDMKPSITNIVTMGRLSGDAQEGVTLQDFRSYMPDHKYIFMPSGDLWVASSINGRMPRIDTGKKDKDGKPVTIAPSTWLDQNRPVEQMTWVPGYPPLIADHLMSDGTLIDRTGCTIFNLYRPPTIALGDKNQATPWLEHVHLLYPGEARHIIQWLAHRVQHPEVKINHGLVLGGAQGIGKDTILEPVKHAVGPWNFGETSPIQLLGRFNDFMQSVILRVSEVRDLGDSDRSLNRYQLYEHMKTFLAAPPNELRIDQKHLRAFRIPNVTGVIITTNHKIDGLYLPPDDRRHFVAWSDISVDEIAAGHWEHLYGWFKSGGHGHVAAFLNDLNLTDFDPNAAPRKTKSFWDIVDAGQSPEDSELADTLEAMGWPGAVTLIELSSRVSSDVSQWLADRRNSRQIPHRMESVGYVRVRNDGAKDGLWKVGGKRQAIYCLQSLPYRDQVKTARERAGVNW